MIYDVEQFVSGFAYVKTGIYKKNYRAFTKYLRYSRIPFLKKNGFYLAVLQNGFINSMVFIQKEISRFSKEKTSLLKEGANTTKVDKKLDINKNTLRILYTIMDGVVVRNLKFNRPFLRVMSENRASGPLEKDSYDNVALLRNLLFRFKGVRIINDITRFLRIGDVTQIKDGKIVIYETKTNITTGVTKIRDINNIFQEMRSGNVPNRQNRRQLVAQMTFVNGRISIPEDVSSVDSKYKERVGVEIIDVDFPIKNHLTKIERMLNRSEEEILVSDLVEDGYLINVFNCGKVSSEEIEKYFEKTKQILPEWTKLRNGETFRTSNYDTFIYTDGEFPRIALPYSVYPFSIKNCVKLMTGEIFVSIYFNISTLKQKLEQAGWGVKEGDYFDLVKNIEAYKKEPQKKGEMFSKKDPVLFEIGRQVPSGIFYVTSIPVTYILNMMLSFYSTDFIVDTVNKQFENSEEGNRRHLANNFIDEENIFI